MIVASKPIKDYAIGIYDGPHATPKEATDGPVFLGIKNITEDGHLDLSEIRHIANEDFAKWTRRVTPQPGDVIFSYEATLHRYALIPEGFNGCLGRRLALVRPDPEKLDSRFLLCYFLSHSWRAVVESSIITGATVDRVPLERFPFFSVSFPDLPIQRRIADILSTYDDLIENNRRKIALLEEAARMIYREWFVRLRFPGYEKTRIVDGVPEGWEKSALGDICSEVKDSVLPDRISADTPYIGLEHIPRRSITLSDWGYAGDVSSTKHRYATRDIVFGKIRPYFHKVGIAFTDGVASSDAIIIRPSQERYHMLVLMMVSSDEFIAMTSQTMREGSKMPRADWKVMRACEVSIPPATLLEAFNEQILPIVDQLKVLAFQNKKLQQARDILLPKLMSGEIEVSERTTDSMIEELVTV